jgi:hypothetical protein
MIVTAGKCQQDSSTLVNNKLYENIHSDISVVKFRGEYGYGYPIGDNFLT